MPRRIPAVAVSLALLCPAGAGSQSTIEVYKLAASSPLATDGRVIFAVADGGRTILAGSGPAGDWKQVAAKPTRGRIRGLAFGRGFIYISDDTGTVYRLKPGDPAGEVLVAGGPLSQPADLAFFEDLLVADPGRNAVFRIDLSSRAVSPLAENLPPGLVHLAADRGDLAVASPDAGEIREPRPFERGSVQQYGQEARSIPLAVWRTREAAAPVSGSRGATVPQSRYPLIQRPSGVTLARGNLYFVDSGSSAVYVTFRQQARPVRVVGGAPVKQPTRLIVLGDSLMVLDGSRGVLERWPLSFPTEFDLGRNAKVALELLYGYLYEARLLPTRNTAWMGSASDTLREARVGLGDPSPLLERFFCTLNRGACGEQARRSAPREVLVPDVPSESVIDYETVSIKELSQQGTLGDELDRRVMSAAFRDYKTDQEIWSLNESALLSASKLLRRGERMWTPGSGPLRDVATATLPPALTLTLPTEKVRCLVALPGSVLREDHGLSKIRLRSEGFNWNPMEEMEAKAYWAAPQDPPSPAPAPAPCDLAALQQKHSDLRDTIHFREVPGVNVSVGVAEQQAIDVHHPIFQGAVQSFSLLPAQAFPQPPATPPASPACREMSDRDHGTAVAGLIAGRGVTGGFSGLAPAVRIVPIRSNDADIGEDIASAFRNRSVRIFNLSLHYRDQVPVNVRQRINQFVQALFVVSAGNDATDGKPVCESVHPYPAYPVCEGHRRNVLVVAATNPAGDGLIERTEQPPAAGSNWNDRLVHVAAPGVGYHAPGRDNSYVPVRGTSFATPLVTATAAMLFAQGVKDPWLLKQRIIATADVKDGLRGKVQGAGLLNVERAVKEPARALLTCDGAEEVVDVEPAELTIKWTGGVGGSRTLPLASVRRLTKSQSGQSYRLVYLDDVTDLLVIQEEVEPGQWPVEFWKLNGGGQRVPPKASRSLESCKDYVGPVL